MKKLLVLITLFSSGLTFAQSDVYIHFVPKVNGTTVTPADLGATTFSDLSGIGFEIQVMSYYISNLKLVHDGGQEINFDTPDDVKLVTIPAYSFNLGTQNITTLESIEFGVGVPNAWNHLDINAYPSGHPLGYQQNPVMHWGWTSGYFHMALTALGDDNGDLVCDQMFETHCLGDGNYKMKTLPVTGLLDAQTNSYHIYVNCNIEEWIYGTDPGTTGVHHTDGGVAITVMDNVELRDVFTASAELGIQELEEIGVAYFSNKENGVEVTWKEMKGMASYQLIDMNGKLMAEGSVNSPSASASFDGIRSGAYIFNCYNGNGKRIHSLNLIH